MANAGLARPWWKLLLVSVACALAVIPVWRQGDGRAEQLAIIAMIAGALFAVSMALERRRAGAADWHGSLVAVVAAATIALIAGVWLDLGIVALALVGGVLLAVVASVRQARRPRGL